MRQILIGAVLLAPALLYSQAAVPAVSPGQSGSAIVVPEEAQGAPENISSMVGPVVTSGSQDVASAAEKPLIELESKVIPAEQSTGVEKTVQSQEPVQHEVATQAKDETQSIETPVLNMQNQKPVIETPALPEAPQMQEAESIQLESSQEKDVEAIDVDKGIGFDTISLEEPEGNWLTKRIWWEKAEVRYEKIKNLVDSILDSRMTFFAQRSEIENKVLDPFYIQNSITQGQLEEVVLFLLDELKRERDREKSLSVAERQLYETLQAEQRTIEQLQLDVEAIRKLDGALDDALSRLMEQINICRNYEKQSWNAFKNIAKVLDHNQARTLYYSMDVYFSNIKAINNYLQNQFAQHFNTLISTIKQNVERIKTSMAALKEKGIDLKQEALKLLEQERALECKIPESIPEKKVVKEEEPEEPESVGWVASIWNYITDFFAGIWDLLTGWW